MTKSSQPRCPGSGATAGFRQAYPDSLDPAVDGIDWREIYMCPFCTVRRRPLRNGLRFPAHAPRKAD